MLPHEDNVLNKFRIWKERHIQMRENRTSHLVGWKTHPTILPRSGFELTTSRSPWRMCFIASAFVVVGHQNLPLGTSRLVVSVIICSHNSFLWRVRIIMDRLVPDEYEVWAYKTMQNQRVNVTLGTISLIGVINSQNKITLPGLRSSKIISGTGHSVAVGAGWRPVCHPRQFVCTLKQNLVHELTSVISASQKDRRRCKAERQIGSQGHSPIDCLSFGPRALRQTYT